MHKSIAKQLYEIATFKDDLAYSCNIKCNKEPIREVHQTTWEFIDHSQLTLDDFGAVKINGHYVN